MLSNDPARFVKTLQDRGGDTHRMDDKNAKEKDDKEELVHTFDDPSPSFFSGKVIVFLVVAALLGIGSGWALAKNRAASSTKTVKNGTVNLVEKGTIIGSKDMNTFKDSTEGVLQEGGIDGEGQYHLVRPGGDSQNVYLTSSIVDLSKFTRHKIKVWGATQKAQKAGWLMDVGRVEVLE